MTAQSLLVPRSRLLVLTAVALVPLLTLAGTGGVGAALAGAGAGLLVAAMIFDALRAWPRLDGLTVKVPEVIRLVKNRAAEITVQWAHEGAAGRPLCFGLALPPGVESEQTNYRVTVPESLTGVFAWPVTPTQRGSFRLPCVAVETESPWGWWALRRRIASRCELRVHPDLASGLRANARFLAQGGAGGFAQRQVGKGREFDKLRDYLPGDASDEIHWKVTAKRRQPVTKVYQIERTQEVYVIVDASRLSSRLFPGAGPASRPEPLLEHALNAALVLGAVAERQGDHFGLVTFSDQVHGFVRARTGSAHYQASREIIVRLQPRLVSPDYEELGTFLRLRLRRRALLLFLTSLEDPVAAEGFLRGVDLLRHQHLCVVVQPRAPDVEPAFARGQAARIRRVDDLTGVLAGHLQWQSARTLELTLRHRGVTSVTAPAGELAGALIQRYLDVKRRQVL